MEIHGNSSKFIQETYGRKFMRRLWKLMEIHEILKKIMEIDGN